MATPYDPVLSQFTYDPGFYNECVYMVLCECFLVRFSAHLLKQDALCNDHLRKKVFSQGWPTYMQNVLEIPL